MWGAGTRSRTGRLQARAAEMRARRERSESTLDDGEAPLEVRVCTPKSLRVRAPVGRLLRCRSRGARRKPPRDSAGPDDGTEQRAGKRGDHDPTHLATFPRPRPSRHPGGTLPSKPAPRPSINPPRSRRIAPEGPTFPHVVDRATRSRFGSPKRIASGSAKEIAAGSAKLIADHWTDVSVAADTSDFGVRTWSYVGASGPSNAWLPACNASGVLGKRTHAVVAGPTLVQERCTWCTVPARHPSSNPSVRPVPDRRALARYACVARC